MSDKHDFSKNEIQERAKWYRDRWLYTIWRHFKGGLYVITNVSVEESTLEIKVTYRSNKTGGDWTRGLEIWDEQVDRPEHSYKGPRFVRVQE